MVARRTCVFVMPDNRQCRAGPQRDRPYCFAHDPDRAEEAAEARKLGGLRRRKEGTIAVAYDLPGLETVEGVRRLVQIVVTDAMGLDNGIARLRVLLAAALAAAKLLETGDLEERLASLEAVHRHPDSEAVVFPEERT